MATIEKRGNSYKITISCGYNSKGVQQRRRMTWTPEPGMTEKQKEKELNRQATLFEERVKKGEAAAGAVKFEQLANEWLDKYAEKHLKERTIERWRSLTGRIYPAIGALRVDKITPIIVQNFIDSLSEPGTKIQRKSKEASSPAGLAPKTVRQYLTFISDVMKYAERLGMITSNPCSKVVPPPLKSVERDCYTLEEAARFLELLQELQGYEWQYRAFFTLAIYSGARRAELLGLEWKDIDFNNCTISICRNSLYSKRKGIYTDTVKTKGSNRVLKLPQAVFDMLREFRVWQLEYRSKLCNLWTDHDRLFTQCDGSPMSPNTPETWLRKFCKRVDIRYVSIHSFRHLNASLLINANVDARTVSAALGHSNTSTTLNIYAHTFAEAQARASEAIGDALSIGNSTHKDE